MNQPTTKTKTLSYSRRRWRSIIVTGLLLVMVALFVRWQNDLLIHSSFSTGYVLMASLLFLAAFNLRKKIPVLPQMGTAAAWMQLHIYVGLSTFLVFALHIGWRIPDGPFELLLAGLYLTVAFSGVYGLYVTRVVPKKLTAIHEEVIFERIREFRQQLAADAQTLVLSACQTTPVLANFYANRLAVFFERPRSVLWTAAPNGRLRKQLVAEIESLDRYLVDDQRAASRQLLTLVRKKDDLDYHHAMQGRLKVWLFAHVGLTYSLLIVAILHGILAHAFVGAN